MFGIAGFVKKNGRREKLCERISLDNMCKVITHAGLAEQLTSFGNRDDDIKVSLSIIGLKSGQQAIYSQIGSKFIILNEENLNKIDYSVLDVYSTFR